jgi:hypothetical protein
MPQSRVILTGDSLNDKPAALRFASKPGFLHAAIWKSNLRRSIESKRRVMPQDLGECSFHVQPFSIPSGGSDVLCQRTDRGEADHPFNQRAFRAVSGLISEWDFRVSA